MPIDLGVIGGPRVGMEGERPLRHESTTLHLAQTRQRIASIHGQRRLQAVHAGQKGATHTASVNAYLAVPRFTPQLARGSLRSRVAPNRLTVS